MSGSPVNPARPCLLKELIDRLGHPDRIARVHAAAELVKQGRQDQAAVRALIEALRQDRQVAVRKMAALVLGDLAPQAQEAIGALAEALGDGDEGLRRRVAVALGRFGSAAAAAGPALQRALNDTDEGVRSFAAASLTLITAPLARAKPAA
jgi:HEAT repeat protein